VLARDNHRNFIECNRFPMILIETITDHSANKLIFDTVVNEA